MSKKFIDFYLDAVTAKKDSGGGGSATLINKDINANGTYNASADSADGYKKVVVDVPNSYTAGDEGKVVRQSMLVPQTGASYAANGTYDTTLINEVTINVPSSGGGQDAEIADRTISAYSNSAVTYVGPYAFAMCTLLSDVNLPACLSVSTCAFSGCAQLRNLSLPSLVSMGMKAFEGCTALAEVNLPACPSIGMQAFNNCTSLQSFHASVCTSIGNNAFGGCLLLTDVDMPNLTAIGSSAFQGCFKLTNITLDKVTSIGVGAFINCSSLTNLMLDNVAFIGPSAFNGCSKLATVSMPKLQSTGAAIGTYAFRGCSSLMSVYILTPYVPSIAAQVFINTPIVNSTYTGEFGTIYVLSSMLESFLAATNWAAYSARIVGM